MRLALLLPLTLACHAFAAWTPPEKPDTQAILNEARVDRMSGRFEDALAKQVWFHERALDFEPSMYGVRASFALADWRNLAEKYPPAMVALVATRDRAAADALQARGLPDSFLDAAAINHELEQPAQTVLLFRGIQARDPALARRVASAAQDALIETGDLATAGRYIDPERELRSALEARSDMLKPRAIAIPIPGFDPTSMANRFFDHRVMKTTALLVQANRNAEAQEFARKVLEAVPTAQASLQRGLAGEMPEDLLPRAMRDWVRKLMP